ncbi:MAG: MoxR family ATPase [Armatimonadota bacterium]|nr:MoxR family ATPase [Armatimonadota bacterium]
MAKTAAVDLKEVEQKVNQVIDEIETVIIGKRDVIRLVLCAVLCNGHILIEDVPGVGKTTLGKSLAITLGCTFRRIQFTPDLLPADITGTSIFNQKTGEFEFRRGPIFAQFVLADEINRATPKAQSSLLECMEERQVTVDGVTYPLPKPFFVIATENNVEYHGTYPLPEAQLDRFMMRVSIGYPNAGEESSILDRQSIEHPIEKVRTILSSDEVIKLQEASKQVLIEPTIRDYIVDIVRATREHPSIALGSSPRGSLHLLHAARALAAISGRDYVLPDDVKAVAIPVLAHRLILKPEARIRKVLATSIVSEIISTIPVPTI